jgi:hypothetical protein
LGWWLSFGKARGISRLSSLCPRSSSRLPLIAFLDR